MGNFISFKPEDFGWTEDEYNNFLIEIFRKRKPIDLDKIPVSTIDKSKMVTITITKKDHYIPINPKNN